MTTDAKVLRLTADRKDSGVRLDLFLVSAERMSRKQAKKLIDTRRVSVGGRIESMASRTMKAGEKVEVRVPEERKEAAPKVDIVHDEDAYIAVAKGPGIPSGPTLDPKRLHAQKLMEQTLSERLTLLHRIDRDTSGLLLMARDEGFAKALLDAFRTREVEKRYLAIVSGRPPEDFEDVCHLKEIQGGKKVAVVKSGGMKSQTSFETLISASGASLVLAKPRTGRMHQLRVQLSRRGFPILGDSLYGGSASIKPSQAKRSRRKNVGSKGRREGHAPDKREVTVERQMLHAWQLAFTHPHTGQRVELYCPPPKDFMEAVKALFGNKAPKLEKLKVF